MYIESNNKEKILNNILNQFSVQIKQMILIIDPITI